MRKLKLRLFVISVCAIVFAFMSQSTLAYYSAIGTATNVITSGDIKLAIHETSGDGTPFPEEGVYVIPGQIVSKKATVENVCEHPFYLRVKLKNSVDDAELNADECFDIDINESSWTVRDDGYIYYNEVLYPGETTPAVFTEVEIVGSKIDKSYIGKVLSLTVSAYAVQQENNPADFPWHAQGWPEDQGGE